MKQISAAYIDSDKSSSVKTFIMDIYPALISGGSLYCADVSKPGVFKLINNDSFWSNELGCRKPYIEGLEEGELVRIVKSGSV